MKKALIFVCSVLAAMVIVCGSGIWLDAKPSDVMQFGILTLIVAGMIGGLAWLISEA